MVAHWCCQFNITLLPFHSQETNCPFCGSCFKLCCLLTSEWEIPFFIHRSIKTFWCCLCLCNTPWAVGHGAVVLAKPRQLSSRWTQRLCTVVSTVWLHAGWALCLYCVAQSLGTVPGLPASFLVCIPPLAVKWPGLVDSYTPGWQFEVQYVYCELSVLFKVRLISACAYWSWQQETMCLLEITGNCVCGCNVWFTREAVAAEDLQEHFMTADLGLHIYIKW